MNLRTLLICIAFLASLSGCTKSYDEPETPPVKDNPNGMFYINVVGDFMKLQTSNDSVHWRSQNMNLFNSWNNPLTFDSNYFYHGNYNSITCYSTSSGLPVWGYSWLAFQDAISYREPAFNDSLIFFTAPTSVWDHGYLFCKNKRTGAAKWHQQIDSGGVYKSFNGIPLVVGDKVISLTRNQYDQKRLVAFSATTGTRLWSVAVNDSMSSKMWTVNGKIYSGYGPNATCYDAANGQLLWHTSLNSSAAWWSYNFVDGDKMIVVKTLNNSDYKIIQLQLSTGTITKSTDLTIPSTYTGVPQILAPLGCAYQNNKLYIASYYSIDSLELFSYDVNTMTQQWKTGIHNHLLTGQAPLATDKYIILPVNDKYDTPGQTVSNMLFLNLSGKEVRKIPYQSIYTDRFSYRENGVLYEQPLRF